MLSDKIVFYRVQILLDLQAGLAMNMIFEIFGENEKYVDFYILRAPSRPAHARKMQHGPLAWSDIECRCWDILNPGVHSGIKI